MTERLKFYDLKARKSFETSKYKVERKGNVKIAYAKSPSGSTSTRILGRA